MVGCFATLPSCKPDMQPMSRLHVSGLTTQHDSTFTSCLYASEESNVQNKNEGYLSKTLRKVAYSHDRHRFASSLPRRFPHTNRSFTFCLFSDHELVSPAASSTKNHPVHSCAMPADVTVPLLSTVPVHSSPFCEKQGLLISVNHFHNSRSCLVGGGKHPQVDNFDLQKAIQQS